MQNFKVRTGRRDNRNRYIYYSRESGKMAKIEIHHRDGGHNYFSGASEKRGIEVCVSMIEVGESGTPGCHVESSMPIEDCNGRYLVIEAARYNKGKLERIAQAIDQEVPALAETWEQDTSAGKNLLIKIAERAAQAT